MDSINSYIIFLNNKKDKTNQCDFIFKENEDVNKQHQQ